MVSLQAPTCIFVFRELLRGLLLVAFSSDHYKDNDDLFVHTPNAACDSTQVPPHLIDLSLQLFRASVRQPHTRLRRSFVERLVRGANLSRQAFILSLFYMQKVLTRAERSPGISRLCKGHSKKISFDKVLIMSMIAASKYLYDDGDDEQLDNDEWADLSGRYNLAAINAMEYAFMSALDWDVHVSLNAYNSFVEELKAMQHEQTQLLCRAMPLSYGSLGRLEDLLGACYDNVLHALARRYCVSQSPHFLLDAETAPPGSTLMSPHLRAYLTVVTPLHASLYATAMAICYLAVYCATLGLMHGALTTLHAWHGLAQLAPSVWLENPALTPNLFLVQLTA